MRRFIFISIIITALLASGCSSIKGIFGKNSNQEAKASARIEQVEDKQQVNKEQALKQISSLSYGIGYALDKITNASPPVAIAQNLNGRILSLSGMPSLDEIKSMQITIENLLTNVTYGKKLLAQRDQIIENIQQTAADLAVQKDKEIDNYRNLAQSTALKADTTKAALDNYKGWFGLKAVFLGLKQFFFTSLWIIVGIVILFIILRLAAASNPIANAIFTVFEQVVSWVIHTVQVLFPKAISMAGHIPLPQFNVYKDTLKEIVDNIQFLKQKDPTAKYTIDEICAQLKMNDQEKAVIDDIKKSLNWK